MTRPTLKSDSYANALTGLASSVDKSSYSFFGARASLQPETLADLYEQDAIAARIVDRLVDDGTREGFFLTGEDEAFDFSSLESEMEDLDAVNAIGDAWRWSRLYGGALLIMVVNDGLRMDQPLNLNRATKLASLQVVESQYVVPAGWNPGLGARAFRRPEYYSITVPFGSAEKVRKVHRSRVVRFDGVRVAPNRMIEKNGWGPSVLDRVYTEISQLGEVMGYARSIMHDMSLQVYKLDGLREQLCGSAQTQQEMRQVMETIRMSVDNLHCLALDTSDDYMEVSRNVGGLRELIEKFIDGLVRATDMPRTVLLGESPSGLNASGDSEIRSWFDFVASQQRSVLTPALNRLLEVIFAIRSNRGEEVPDEWSIEFRPLWQPTAQERAETILKTAQSAQILIANDITSPDEVRAQMISMGWITPLEAPDDVGLLEDPDEPEEPDDELEEEMEPESSPDVEEPDEDALDGDEEELDDAEGFRPPEAVAAAARRGLDYRSRDGGGGGTAVGVARARDLANRRSVSEDTVRRMRAFFTRHEKNKAIDPQFRTEPWRDRGHVAWLLWGGDPGRSWADRVIARIERDGES
jgi:phage-related protein (TIGR01555 family)